MVMSGDVMQKDWVPRNANTPVCGKPDGGKDGSNGDGGGGKPDGGGDEVQAETIATSDDSLTPSAAA
jgi:hypothetical protein